MHNRNQNWQTQSKNEDFKEIVALSEEGVDMDPESPDEPTIVPSETSDTIAVVVGCVRLNVRDEANSQAAILTTIPVDTEVMVDLINSTDKFYKVCTASGIEGFCMKQFIELQS